MHVHPDWRQVIDGIDRQELTELALAMGNIASPPGGERPMAEFVVNWLTEAGFSPRTVALVPERPNVIATLPGTGGGMSLLFNSHMDTSKLLTDTQSLRDPRDPIYHKAWLDGEVIVGEGVLNDKGPMAAFMIAAKAIKEARVSLLGDLVLTMVSGEIGHEPVDEFTTPEFLSKELSTRYLISRGAVADYVLVAEGTNFGMAWTGAGKAFFKITVYGHGVYTPYVPPRRGLGGSPNAIVKMAAVIAAFEDWAARYEVEHTVETPGGTVIPKASIGSIRGGNPFKVIETSQVCSIYVDVRLVPGADPLAVREQLRAVLKNCGVEGTVELFTYRRGQVATGVEPLVEAIGAAHGHLGMAPPAKAEPVISSMWRDHIPFIEAGMPALTYGPGAATGGPRLAMRLDDLYRAAQVYALIALDICHRRKEP